MAGIRVPLTYGRAIMPMVGNGVTLIQNPIVAGYRILLHIPILRGTTSDYHEKLIEGGDWGGVHDTPTESRRMAGRCRSWVALL